MANPCFYCPDLKLDSELIALSNSEASHATKSRRLGAGKKVNLINGAGLFASAHITEVENRLVKVQIDKIVNHSRERRLTIATAIPKRDRQRVMIDMLTQLGVSDIIPLACEYSVTRFKSNMSDKWNRAAIEACKQSQNPWVPEIHEQITPADLVEASRERLVFADAQSASLSDLVSSQENPIVMIGPEGGFSPAETSLFYGHDIKSVTLGRHILRTETAAVSAAALFL